MLTKEIERVILCKAILEYDKWYKEPSRVPEESIICTYHLSISICQSCFIKKYLPWTKDKGSGTSCCHTFSKEHSIFYIPIACESTKDDYTDAELSKAAKDMRDLLIRIVKEHYVV